MKKRWYIITIVLVALGVIVGGVLENKRVTGKLQNFNYVSDVPVSFSITEQEMGLRPQLLALFEKYGEEDKKDKDIERLVVPNDQKELLDLLPSGSIVTHCQKAGRNIEIYYDWNEISYHVIYMETHVQKCIDVEYKNKKYTIINTDNKEFDLCR